MPQDSGITITNYKESEPYSTKSDFVELMCKKFSKWKNDEKTISYIRHNNSLENKVLIKIAKDSQWKLGIIMVYTGKSYDGTGKLARRNQVQAVHRMLQLCNVLK